MGAKAGRHGVAHPTRHKEGPTSRSPDRQSICPAEAHGPGLTCASSSSGLRSERPAQLSIFLPSSSPSRTAVSPAPTPCLSVDLRMAPLQSGSLGGVHMKGKGGQTQATLQVDIITVCTGRQVGTLVEPQPQAPGRSPIWRPLQMVGPPTLCDLGAPHPLRLRLLHQYSVIGLPGRW